MDSLSFLLGTFQGAFVRLAQVDREVFEILWLSLKIAFISTLGGLAASLPIAWAVHRSRPWLRGFLSLSFQVLTSVPTVIIGTIFFLFLSRSGPFGALELLYTPTAIIIGDLFLVIPLMTVFLLTALNQVPAGISQTAQNLGASKLQVAMTVLRECRLALAVATCTGFGRVISEVGAAMILGGNVRGLTRTLTTAISLEIGKGETELSLALGILLLLLSVGNALIINAFPRWLSRDRQSPQRSLPSTDPFAFSPAPNSAELKEPLRFSQVSLKLGGNQLFQDFSTALQVAGGTLLMGRSGVGKTTLLKLIAHLQCPDQGHLEVGGRKAILVFQRPFLFTGTVFGNLAFGLVIRSLPEEQVFKKVSSMATTLGLDSLLFSSVHRLSAGEAARVSLGRALILEPDLLLIDETLVHLDEKTLSPILQTLQKFVASGRGLILVAHQPQICAGLCRQNAVLEANRFVPMGG